jgi:hypothetical protein
MNKRSTGNNPVDLLTAGSAIGVSAEAQGEIYFAAARTAL